MTIQLLGSLRANLKKYHDVEAFNPSKGIRQIKISKPLLPIPAEGFFVYALVVDGLVVKIGQSGSPAGTFGWYETLTRNMGQGRFVPHLYMRAQIDQGHKVERMSVRPKSAIAR